MSAEVARVDGWTLFLVLLRPPTCTNGTSFIICCINKLNFLSVNSLKFWVNFNEEYNQYGQLCSLASDLKVIIRQG
jgi:hypothetical protein